jgi:hypothetical protein
MHVDRFRTWLAVVAGLAILLPAAVSLARNACVADAAAEHKECKADCKEDYQAAKDACLDRDHDCVEVCRAHRSECREATGIDAAISACNATLYDARKTCRDTYAAGTPERDACIDQAQVVAFVCRDTAREQAKPLLKQCRKDFRACARTCARNDPPNPLDRKQCKLDALVTYRGCKADCREDFQVAKDGCKHRDHACAEQCREDRADCRQPVLDQRDAAIAQCNATRSAAVDNCRTLYGEGTPERDACIDQAQVVAFRCRDDAREAARPDLKVCRDAFRACVQSCPPPA